jgi:septal ring factor EnvC (AmiA/AmiB activator)
MMSETTNGTAYKSRPKVLLAFFRRSRDNWKRKCRKAKADLKLVKNQNRAVEKSRAKWKAQAKELEAELRGLREELEEQKMASSVRESTIARPLGRVPISSCSR